MLVFPKHGVFSENTMFYIECLQNTMFKKKIDKFRGSWFFRYIYYNPVKKWDDKLPTSTG